MLQELYIHKLQMPTYVQSIITYNSCYNIWQIKQNSLKSEDR
jgi:hypothetical protein